MTILPGATGRPVLELQRALLALGYPLPRWGADGVLGSETLFAIAQVRGLAEMPAEVTDADLAAVAARVRAGAADPVTRPVLRAIHLLTDTELGNATHPYQLGTGDYRGEGKPLWTTNNGGTGADCWGLIAYVHRQPRHRPGYNAGGSVVDWIQCDSCIEDAEGPGVAWQPAEHPEPGDVLVWPSILRGGKHARIGHVALIESTARLRGSWTGVEWDRLDVIHVCGPNGRRPAAVRQTGSIWARRDQAGSFGTREEWRSRVLRVVTT